MFSSGLILLVMGMGMTFLFLYVMILCTNLSSKFVPRLQKYIPDPEPKKAAKPAASVATDDTAVVAAIAAAMVKANA